MVDVHVAERLIDQRAWLFRDRDLEGHTLA